MRHFLITNIIVDFVANLDIKNLTFKIKSTLPGF
jgi:hypothetical protein